MQLDLVVFVLGVCCCGIPTGTVQRLFIQLAREPEAEELVHLDWSDKLTGRADVAVQAAAATAAAGGENLCESEQYVCGEQIFDSAVTHFPSHCPCFTSTGLRSPRNSFAPCPPGCWGLFADAEPLSLLSGPYSPTGKEICSL